MRRSLVAAVCAAVLVLTGSTVATAEERAPATFTNPIKRNGPDPWMTYHNGYYYLATTTWNSTITMRRATTLAGLNAAPDQVIFNLAGRPNGCCNMWAPEFHLVNGRWYLYYVAGQNVSDYNPTQRLHVLESAGTDPMARTASRPISATTGNSTRACSRSTARST